MKDIDEIKKAVCGNGQSLWNNQNDLTVMLGTKPDCIDDPKNTSYVAEREKKRGVYAHNSQSMRLDQGYSFKGKTLATHGMKKKISFTNLNTVSEDRGGQISGHKNEKGDGGGGSENILGGV